MQPDDLPTAPTNEDQRRRQEYDRELKSGADKFFHPRMKSCPWCASTDIGFRIRVTDMRQWKPGTFEMHECASCGHVFQNPSLTETGLAYYCRDFYDGLGRDNYRSVARYSRSAHRRRVKLLEGLAQPQNWLDVGARHGHLCCEARELLPGTRFWALDPSQEVIHARDRHWVDMATRTPLIEFAEDHKAAFDVVSAIHYLERTTSPREELQAVRKVLRDGGVALIELVNPESRYARLHGKFWYSWLAPQNMNLMPFDNMCRLLRDNGFEIKLVQRGKANKPFDNLAALIAVLNRHLPHPEPWPWLDRSVGLKERLLRKGALVLASPALGLALAVDLLVHQVTVRGHGGNTYRIVAVAR